MGSDKPEDGLPRARYAGQKTVLSREVKENTRRTYVFHGSREGDRLTSIFQTCCLQRTMWTFPRDRPCTRRCDLSRGPARLVEKSIFERLLVSSSLWKSFNLPDRGDAIGITNTRPVLPF